MASIPSIEITPLMLACQNNNPDDVKSMLSKGAAVDAKDSNDRTALLHCAENIETEGIELLLSYNAQINHQDKDGYSCLHLAVICGNLTIVQYLVKMGADVNISDGEMHSAIHWSVVCGHDEILEFLLENNADPETADIHGAYPIHYAAQMCGQIDIWDESISRNQSKSLVILKKLIDQKVKIDVEDFDQRNAIIWAASSGSSEALLELFAAGSDPNKHEKDGLTALHCAASRGHLECMKILIEQCKTSVDIMDNNNCTPIFYAATLGQVSACNLLLKYGSNLHVQDCKGRTAYHCAAAKGQLKCLKILCRKNSDIWLRNRRGDFPIHEAYYNKQMECVYYLMGVIKNKKASKSSNIYDGRTLLHLAAADNDLKLCKRLIADEVDVNCLMKASSSSFMTPYDIAVLKNAKDVAKYLKSIGGLIGSEVAEKNSDDIKKNFKNIIDNEKNSLINYENDSEPENEHKITNKIQNQSLNKPNKNDSDFSHNLAEKNVIPKPTKNVKKTDKNKKRSNNVIPIYDSEKTLIQTNSKENRNNNDLIKEKRKKKLQEAQEIRNEKTKKKIETLSIVYDKRSKKSNETENNFTLDKEKQKSLDYGDSDVDAEFIDLGENSDRTNHEISPNDRKNESKDDGLILKIKNDDLVNENEALANSSKSRVPKENHAKLKLTSRKTEIGNSDIENSYKDHQKNEEIFDDTFKKLNRHKKDENDFKNFKSRSKKIILKKDSNDFDNDDDQSDNEDEKKYVFSSNHTNLPDINDRSRSKPTVPKNYQKKKINQKNSNKLKKSANDLPADTSLPERNTLKIKEFKYPTSENQAALSKKESSNFTQNGSCQNEDSIVRLVIKPNDFKSNLMGKKNYGSLFDQQRLVLKSLYEIRRCRINNRDIVINSELNNLLLKQYDFDIKKNCRSLKELEKLLEVIAIEISEEFKKYNKRSHTLVSFKSRNQAHNSKSCERVTKSSDRKYFRTSEENLSRSNETPNNDIRLKNEKHNAQYDQLKTAYRSLLPNDIYKQYYQSRSNTKITPQKDQPAKERTILLPVINHKTGFTT